MAGTEFLPSHEYFSSDNFLSSPAYLSGDGKPSQRLKKQRERETWIKVLGTGGSRRSTQKAQLRLEKKEAPQRYACTFTLLTCSCLLASRYLALAHRLLGSPGEGRVKSTGSQAQFTLTEVAERCRNQMLKESKPC